MNAVKVLEVVVVVAISACVARAESSDRFAAASRKPSCMASDKPEPTYARVLDTH